MSEEVVEVQEEEKPEAPGGGDGADLFKCTICGRGFKTAAGVKLHANSHNPKMVLRGRLGVKGKRGIKRAAPIKTAPPDYQRDALKPTTAKATQPWRPASIITATKLDGFRSKWVRKDLLEKRIEEGWEPRLSDSKGRFESPEKTMVDGVPLSRYVVKRNLVLCDMPEELAQSREAYYKRITDQGLSSQKTQFQQEAAVGGLSYAYGDIKIEK